jgi:hypothetical protein
MSTHTFLVLGCIFPVIGWLSVVGAYINEKVTGKSSSAVLIPFIGPLFINSWSAKLSHPSWVYAIPWIADIATISFILVLPLLLNDAWEFSTFTELLSVKSQVGNKTANLSLHKNNKFIIRFNWFRQKGESGVIAMNDFGSYIKDGEEKYILTSHVGSVRTLEKSGNVYRCTDNQSTENTNINGYEFT